MFITEWIKITNQITHSEPYIPTRPRLSCKDGFSFSIQASEFTYCEPRESKLVYYKSVEVGFPEMGEEPYQEELLGGGDDGGVWGWVPIETVEAIIVKHGGIDVTKTVTIANETGWSFSAAQAAKLRKIA